MKLTECYTSGFTAKLWDWGQYNCELKHDYRNECGSEVKTYTLNKKELEKYLKKFE
jgi:hypothetical protein